jgi:tRNA (cytidine/uridine-2'-O-)-methyltransferase
MPIKETGRWHTLHIVLFQPEIPPNTGNIVRLCAATQTPLHLIEPLGFSLEDRYLRRAGLDYWPYVNLAVWPDLAAYLGGPGQERRLIATSAKGGQPVHRTDFTGQDSLLFGPETRGLPDPVLDMAACRVCIPQCANTVRSLNLSTAVGIILYQALACCGALDAWPPNSHPAKV